jgi:hypothetical protein
MKKPSSKKIDTTIVVALIALVGTLATALFNSSVILEWIRNKPSPTTPSAQIQSPIISANSMPIASIQSRSGGNTDCLTQHFANIEPVRQISIEVGVTAQDYFILSQDLSKKDFLDPIGIKLTQNGKMIAGLSFIFFTESHLFKITSVVDSNCQAVAEYSNASRVVDRNAIQNSDTLKIQLTEGSFSLNFQFSGTDFFRFNFQQLP